MSTNTPSTKLLIKKFRTAGKNYVYSAVNNEIVSLNTHVWNRIDEFTPQNSTDDEVDTFIQKNIDSGFWSYKKPEISTNRDNSEEIAFLLKKLGMEQLILNLTDQCNMRCSYCTFSGNYDNERVHSDKHMTRDTAFKALNYFLNNLTPSLNKSVTFYGGEVLIRFSLLRELIDFVRNRDKGITISFTTNATLLTEDILEYLIENNIKISVSLDGNREMHDKHRLMRNGKGSFDIILKNLQKAREMSKSFFDNNISYLPVLTPPYDVESMKEFFYSSDLFDSKKVVVTPSPVSLHGTSMFKENSQVFYGQLNSSIDKMLRNYEQHLINNTGENYNLEEEWFEDMVKAIHFREKRKLEDTHPAMGQCTPGLRRLLVNSDGNYYMCERVGEHLKIGDIHNGLDLKTIAGFFKQWNQYFSSCGSCWAVRLCRKCFTEFHTAGEFDDKRLAPYCDSALEYYEMLLISYCYILENNPEAFNRFKPVRTE